MKLKQEFVTIPAGDVKIEEMLIKVESFKLSNLCVTAGEFAEWKGLSKPLKPNKPAIGVTWFEAEDFAKAHGCRLPTEAEWQWAAQGGELKQTWAGTSEEIELDKFVWFGEFNRKKPHRVGKKSPNAFGLFDMSGNVWEWCVDAVDAKHCVLRGGAFLNDTRGVRCAARDRYNPLYRYYGVGFRVVFGSPYQKYSWRV